MADIRKRKNTRGGIIYQVRFIDQSKKTGFGYKSFDTSKKAIQFKAQKDLSDNDQSVEITSNLSVPDAITMWINICERIGRDGREPVEAMTLVEYVRRAKVMKEYSWQKPVSQLVVTDIVKFRTWLLENYSRDLARRSLSSFCSVLKEMCLQGHLATNPATGISIRSNGRHEMFGKEIDIPSDKEVKDILEASLSLRCKNKIFEKAWARYRPMILLPTFAGLRMSELRGLRWQDLDEESVQIKQRADKMGFIGPVKSRAARRTIELSRKVTDEIFEWRERCPPSKYDLIFPAASGRPLLHHNFDYDAWRPLMKEANLLVLRDVRGVEKLHPKYTPHTLRHYYASKLIELGKDIKYIQTRMGHSNAEVTLNVYGHIMKDREEEHRQTANELAGELL